MKYVSEKYRNQLDSLAEMLCKPLGAFALDETIEIDEIIDRQPPNLRLLTPPERGWKRKSPDEAA